MKPETIPNNDSVYSWLHYKNWSNRKNRPGSSAFRFDDDGMSCYWSAKISAKEVRALSFNLKDNGVMRFPVDKIREKKKMDVIHTPHLGKSDAKNSHSSIAVEAPVTETEAITHLRDIYKLPIPPPGIEVPENRIE